MLQLVEQQQFVGGIGHQRLGLLPGGAGGSDVAGAVLGLPGEAHAHGVDGHQLGEALEQAALAGLPAALDELHDADPEAMAEAAHDHAEGGRRLALALAGVDDEQAFLDRLGRHDLGARGPPLGRLLGVARIDLGFGQTLVLHGRFNAMNRSDCQRSSSSMI